MTAPPRLPNPLTPDGLRTLMRERPYWDPSHPRSKIYHRLVQRGFEILYPGDVRYGARGTIDATPLKPEHVTHLVAEANREMEEIERGFDETERGGGAVHVQSHTRENGKVEVADYWRAAPGAGVSSESGRGSGQTMETGEDDQSPQTAESDSDDLPEMTNPVPGGRIRGCDGPPYGCGNFGASRTKDDGAEYKHQGVDIAVEPGQPVYSPVSGKIEGPPFDPYGSNSSKAGLYQGITIRTEDGYRVRVLYVDPSVMADQRVEAGTVIGKSQDLSLGYPPKGETQMTNHVHVDVMKGGQYKDPTGIFRDR